MVAVNSTFCPQNHYCPLIRMCPAGAISQKGNGLPLIDEEKCTECGKCVRYCPMNAVESISGKYA